jgi:hypothetical protein
MKKSAAPKAAPAVVPLHLDPDESIYLRRLVGPRLAAWGFDISKALTIVIGHNNIESTVTGLLDEAILEANLPMTIDFLALPEKLEESHAIARERHGEIQRHSKERKASDIVLNELRAALVESDALREFARREISRLSGLLEKASEAATEKAAAPSSVETTRPPAVEAALSSKDAALVASGRRLEEALRRGRTEYSESGRFELQKRDREGGGTEYQPAPIGAKLGDKWERFLRVERDRNGFGWNETPIAKTGIETSRPFVPGVPRGLGALESLTKLGKGE